MTVKPCGAVGVLPSGQPNTLLKFVADFVAYGFGNSRVSNNVMILVKY